MGVSGLLSLLKSIQKPCSLKSFSGQTLGVDAYGWLHRASVSCAIELAQGKPTTKLVDFAMHRVRMLMHFGVTPYIVFDGDHLPSKSETEKGRAERRKESRRAGLELLQLGKIAQAHQELQKAVDITPELAKQLILELRRNNVAYIVAPYEADSQLVYLEKKGIIDGILSEDSDLLVFGAKCLLTKLDQYGECIAINREDFTKCREVNLVGWTCDEFRRMAILSGCDYLAGIHKMGLKTAYRLVRKYKTLERIVRCAQLEGKFQIPTGYMDSFVQAEKTFLYQWVYCPSKKCLVNLTDPDSEEQLAGITYIGRYVEPDIAIKVAEGDLNPMTKRPIVVDNIYNMSRRTPLLTKAVSIDSGKAQSIDSFFKPKRVPLAEVDTNTFTPSPSQQRLLQQNIGRSWPFDPADSRPTSAPSRATNGTEVSAIGRRVSSAPHPFKRQRLCGDTADSKGEKSKFFTAVARESSPSLARGGFKKKSKLPEVNIWSDDSLDEAMAALPETAFFSTPLPSTPSLSFPSAAAGSLPSAPRLETPEKTLGTSNGYTALDLAGPEGYEPKEKEQEGEGEVESIFSTSLIAQTRALRETFSYNKISEGLSTTPAAPKLRTQHEIEPLTPLQPQKQSTNKLETVPTSTLSPEVGVPETPQLPQPKIQNSVSPSSPTAPRIKDSPLVSLDPTNLKINTHWPTTHPPKGSEDLLVVPDSDAESEWGRDLVESSPQVDVHAVKGDEGVYDDDDDDHNEGERPFPRLNLAAFAFTGAGW